MTNLYRSRAMQDAEMSNSSFLPSLPSELLFHILSYLDIPDLLSISRTMHYLRTISLDPLLHTYRLQRASVILSRAIPSRPPLTELMARRVYITRTTLTALNLGRSLTMIRLKRQLERRPTVERLIELGVLPPECYLNQSNGISTTLGLYRRRKVVQKEKVRNFLAEWIGELSKRITRRMIDSSRSTRDASSL
ncbi:putative f-box domain-containing protein [Erysiphe necator]|uniref:Putative f-box domain-containing protein n=1 Tax=Uncinula necator TaxID=52586 RepID=A0A0B1P811_UNCNE|nr:putative f-box domain-containing protein [Erysiphe necator]